MASNSSLDQTSPPGKGACLTILYLSVTGVGGCWHSSALLIFFLAWKGAAKKTLSWKFANTKIFFKNSNLFPPHLSPAYGARCGYHFPANCGGHPKLSTENICRTEKFLYHFSGFRKETNKSLKNELKDSLQISRILETLLQINTCFSSRCLHPTVFVFFVLALFLLFSKHRTLLTFCVSEIKFAWTIDKSWVRYLGTWKQQRKERCRL